MHHPWLHQLYHEYRQGSPDAVAGVRTLQRRVQVGCACPRDVAILKGLDGVHASIGQDIPSDRENIVIDQQTMAYLLDLVAQARRPAPLNRQLTGTASLRHRGGMTVAGWPAFGASHGGFSRGGAAARAVSPGAGPVHTSTAMTHPSQQHHGLDFRRRGGGGGGWGWGWPWGWGNDCVWDQYGRVWCWTPYGWQVQS
jgi:hypothetical protein